MHRNLLTITLLLSFSLALAQTEFLATARDGDLATVNAAIAAGANVNITDEFGQTALMYAAGANSDPKVIRVIIAAGAHVNAQSLAGWTALMYAVRDNSNPLVIDALLEANADVTLRNSDQNRAIDYATQNANAYKPTLYVLYTQTRQASAPPPAPAAPVTATSETRPILDNPFAILKYSLDISHYFVEANDIPCISPAQQAANGVEVYCWQVQRLQGEEVVLYVNSGIVADNIVFGEVDQRASNPYTILTQSVLADGQMFAIQYVVHMPTGQVTAQLMRAR